MEQGAKKLTLSKETLRTLSDDELGEVVGGQTGICVNTVVCNSGVCNSAICESAVLCHSGVCDSAVCGSAVCSIICGV